MSRGEPIDGLLGVMPVPIYECSEGHDVFAPEPNLDRCPRSGCAGTLRRVGPGSRKASSNA